MGPETRELSAAKAFARETVQGLWIAIPTPFSADGRHVDEAVLEAAVEHYVETLQVDGIFCGGVMGEFWSLTMDERRRVHAVVARQVAGRVPVMAHVGHHAFAETAALCAHASDHGIPLGIAMNPYYPPHPPDELVRAWYGALDRATDLPLFLFNTTYSGYALSPELIAELAELDIVCGIKNPQGKAHLLRLQELVGDRIIVTDAAEPDWLDLHVNHGFRSLMSTPALALFQRAGELPIVEYTRRADAGDLEGARAVSDSLGPARAVFERWMSRPWTERNVVPIAQLKAWLGRMGLPHGPVRLPLVPLTREEQLELDRDLERLGLVG
ncbi:MAG: dihydrodipicolinate synthase family protein [Actinomycetota bacterium]|nr:dihydrodipicolinate synthase family protein [Actinomycetota bacterium]